MFFPVQGGVEVFTLDGALGFGATPPVFFPAPSAGFSGFQVLRVP